MTERPCGICKKPVMYGSTATDVLCLDCAKEHSICKQCGADRELRPHRRKFPKLPLEEKVEANRRAAIAKRATTVTLLPMAKPNGSSVILKSGALVQPKMHGVKGFVTATGVMLPKRITNPADKFTDCGRPAGSPYEGQD